MSNPIRDFERIEESTASTQSRKFGLLSLALLTLLTIMAAAGMALSEEAKPVQNAKNDILAIGIAKEQSDNNKQEQALSRTELTFPELLDDSDHEQDVELSVAAAVAEAKALAIAEGKQTNETLPAALHATEVDDLSKAALQDPLVAESMQQSAKAIAPAGSPGAYMLQVISYRQQPTAQRFAHTLRERGHKAFVIPVDLQERGQYWRVRIGPFGNKHEAENYRHDFEEREQMNTLVVRRQEES